MLRSPPGTRRGQTAAYLLFAAAGAGAIVWPSPSVQATTSSRLLLMVWVGFLITGGLSSALGRMFGRWPGEFVGIPLLGAAFAIYAAATLYATIHAGRYTGVTAGMALGAIFCLVVARWWEVDMIRVEAVRRAHADRHDRGIPDELDPTGGIRSHRRAGRRPK